LFYILTPTDLVSFVVVFGAEAAVATRGVLNNFRKSSLVRTALLATITAIYCHDNIDQCTKTNIFYTNKNTKHFYTNLSSSAGAIGLEYISSIIKVIFC